MATATDLDRLKKDFGLRLRAMTLDKGWNQSELARRSELGRDNISGYITGKYIPNPPHLVKIAKALGVQPKDLFPETDLYLANKFQVATVAAPSLEEPASFHMIEAGDGKVRVRIIDTLPRDAVMRIMDIIKQSKSA